MLSLSISLIEVRKHATTKGELPTDKAPLILRKAQIFYYYFQKKGVINFIYDPCEELKY